MDENSLSNAMVESTKDAEATKIDNKPLVGLDDMAKHQKDVHGLPHWQLPAPAAMTIIIDTSGPVNSQKLNELRSQLNTSELGINQPETKTETGSTRLIDLEKEWQQKQAETSKHIIFTIDDAVIYPSKGCP